MSLDVSVRRQLRGFSLDVAFRTGEGWLGILGASGCGKSMTLKCIAGIETPGSGRIAVNGRELYSSEKRIDIKPRKRRVGYLFQNYALFPNMRVAENIGCGLGRGPQRRRTVEEMIRRFRLDGLEDRYPGQLSGGQQQRVALARILAHDPDVLLLDEPFTALDSFLKEQLQAELVDLLGDYRGDVVMVTHSRDEVYRMCGSLLVMDAGRVVAGGDTREMFSHPRHLAVARLTGCKNYSRVRVTGARTVQALDWGVPLTLPDPVPPDTDYIGVRAHSFLPAAGGQAENTFPVTVRERLESPFEWNIVFTVNGAPAPQRLWWMYPKGKYAGNHMPTHLTVNPQGILPLCSQGRELD